MLFVRMSSSGGIDGSIIRSNEAEQKGNEDSDANGDSQRGEESCLLDLSFISQCPEDRILPVQTCPRNGSLRSWRSKSEGFPPVCRGNMWNTRFGFMYRIYVDVTKN